nr:Pr6Pr family membrane protein [Rhodococcus sp. NBC_00294]
MTPPDDRVATPVALRVLRVVAALLGLAALIWIPVRSADVAGFSLANFFSYFTVLSNVLAVVVFVVGGVVDPRSETFDRLRGAATTYMVITGIVYAVLLSNVDVQIQDAWTNSVLHRIVPVLIVLDWILAPPRRRSAESGPVLWLVFPVVYGVYSLIRGPIVDWYPIRSWTRGSGGTAPSRSGSPSWSWRSCSSPWRSTGWANWRRPAGRGSTPRVA